MIRKRGSNAARQPGRNEGVPVEIEMAALDDLGPRARAAICNAPLGTLAVSIVSQVVDVNNKIEAENEQRAAAGLQLRPYLDPKEPRLDANLAAGITDYNFRLLCIDRPVEDARSGVIPLRPRPSPHSVREQRKAMRGARRWSTYGRP
jgi:hypothetical protein